MIEPGSPKRVVAEVCIPDDEGGKICATAREPLRGTGRAWVDCRVRTRKLAEAARDGEEGGRFAPGARRTSSSMEERLCCVPSVGARQAQSGRWTGLSRQTEGISEGSGMTCEPYATRGTIVSIASGWRTTQREADPLAIRLHLGQYRSGCGQVAFAKRLTSSGTNSFIPPNSPATVFISRVGLPGSADLPFGDAVPSGVLNT